MNGVDDHAVERAEAERKTRASMRSMPLWRDHPALADA
jgi:hypothetical protein